jgi:two-component system alkaline phosphatase synthesis response regulator PhoP
LTQERSVDPLLCYPDPLPEDLARALQDAGYGIYCINRGELADSAERSATKEGWPGSVVSALSDLQGALAVCRHLRRREVPLSPLLLVVGRHQVSELQLRNDLFDDFCAAPYAPGELTARLEHLFWRSGRGLQPEVIEHGPLVLNLETYQAAVTGRTLDLTYMEYELLRFLASHPGKVFTRETLLSRVWGYEYYGGARTVDVHIRRLRAKLGEEHAHLIHTVRSVGYRFGQGGWNPAASAPDRSRIEGVLAPGGLETSEPSRSTQPTAR